jgi:carbon-monoxide dehydrogenase large subunit
MSILGTRVLRTEDPRFLTTGGVYTEDLTDDRLAGACHVFFVRSPIAHARIRRVDVSAALAAPGVIAAYTGADLADLPSIEPMMAGMLNAKMTRRLLAIDRVRFVGEPVAVVVTEDPYQGEDALELVDVDYDPLPAVVDFDDALSNDVVLFEDAGTNVVVEFGNAPEARAFRRLRDRGQPHLHQPAGRACPDGIAGGRRGVGRGWQADQLDP